MNVLFFTMNVLCTLLITNVYEHHAVLAKCLKGKMCTLIHVAHITRLNTNKLKESNHIGLGIGWVTLHEF